MNYAANHNSGKHLGALLNGGIRNFLGFFLSFSVYNKELLGLLLQSEES